MHPRLAWFAFLGLLSCDAEQPPSTTPDDAAEEAAVADVERNPPQREADRPTWAEMTRDQKIEHMEHVVVPAMAAKFQSWDAQRFAEFGCQTCHGPSAAQGRFEMPNPELPHLGDFEELEQSKPRVVEFMTEVEVEMADLLDMEPYDPQTHEGFGCGQCHVWK